MSVAAAAANALSLFVRGDAWRRHRACARAFGVSAQFSLSAAVLMNHDDAPVRAYMSARFVCVCYYASQAATTSPNCCWCCWSECICQYCRVVRFPSSSLMLYTVVVAGVVFHGCYLSLLGCVVIFDSNVLRRVSA